VGAQVGVRKKREEFRNGKDALYHSICDLKQQMAANLILAGNTNLGYRLTAPSVLVERD
jgi:hypothetical protein